MLLLLLPLFFVWLLPSLKDPTVSVFDGGLTFNGGDPGGGGGGGSNDTSLPLPTTGAKISNKSLDVGRWDGRFDNKVFTISRNGPLYMFGISSYVS